MGEIKYNLKADGIAYLYRSAFYLAKGDTLSGLMMLKKAEERIDQNEMEKLQPLFENPDNYLSNESKKRFWAEKILNEYRRLFNLLPK